MQGRPARVPSPWIERKISVIVMMFLSAPGRDLPALAPLNENHRRDHHNRSTYKTKWF
jgi:hypothetical protein